LHAALTEQCTHLAPDSLLFTYGGQPVKKGSDFLKKLWARVGFHFRFHDLRHTFATRLAAVCANPHVVRVALGHALSVFTDPSLPSVTGRYVHPGQEEIRQALYQMEDLTLAALDALPKSKEESQP
jgi:integrase